MADPEQPESDVMEEPESPPLPGWVPVLIGGVLVAIAGLAVWTGLRYRSAPEERVQSLGASARVGLQRTGAPGEPLPGSSRIFPGDAPPAETPEPADRSRVSITGGPQGVETTVRYRARRGVYFQVDPPDSIVFINEQQIGPANQFASPDEAYEFADEGKFSIRLVAPDGSDDLLIITTDPAAPEEVVRIARKIE